MQTHVKSKWIFRIAESLFAVLFALSMFILGSIIGSHTRNGIFIFGWPGADHDVDSWDSINISLVAAVLISLITGAGTVSAIVLGWRNDKRTERETALRVRKLELEIENMTLQQVEMRDSLGTLPNKSSGSTAK